MTTILNFDCAHLLKAYAAHFLSIAVASLQHIVENDSYVKGRERYNYLGREKILENRGTIQLEADSHMSTQSPKTVKMKMTTKDNPARVHCSISMWDHYDLP